MRLNWLRRLLAELGGDSRYAVRAFLRNVGFTIATVATLALGIGANTAVFSVVNATLIEELPVRNPGELVIFYWLRLPDPMVAGYSGYGRPGPGGAGIRTSFSYLTFERFREHNSTLSSVFAIAPLRNLDVHADGLTDTASGDLVSGNYFDALGVEVVRGRPLTRSDDRPGAEPAAVISHRYWHRRFNADPAVIGKTVVVNGTALVIVGVAAEGFDGTRVGESSDLTIPISMASLVQRSPIPSVSQWWVQIMGRLNPGTTREQALADLQRVFVESVRESWAARPASTTQAGTTVPQLRIMSGSRGPDGPRLDAIPLLAGVTVVAAAVLLIGCVNVANLALVRALHRRREVFVRMALGASRSRLIRQALTESLLLAFCGGLAGTGVAFWGKDFLAWLPSSNMGIVDAELDITVFLFAGGLSVVSAVLFGFAPGLRATRGVPLSRAAHVQRHGITRRTLVVAQLTVSLLLLVVAGLFLQTVHNFGRVDIGFDTSSLLVFRVNPSTSASEQSRIFQSFEEMIGAIQAIPGVRSATMSLIPVLARAEWSATVSRDGGTTARTAYIQGVGPNFFETMRIPLQQGRALSPTDREGAAPVAVISEAMARHLFEGMSPIGQFLQFQDGPQRNGRVEIVGVARDSAYARLEEPAPAIVYLPYRQLPPAGMTFEVRTDVEPLSVAPAIRKAVQRVDAAVALAGLTTQETLIARTIALPKMLSIVTSLFGIVGLVLACIGLYGIVSFDATRRTAEVGIRMALGAQRSDIVRLMLRDTIRLVLIGGVIGLVLSIVAVVVARHLFFGVGLSNPVAMLAGIVLLAASAGLAAYVPARRASGLDPTVALRTE